MSVTLPDIKAAASRVSRHLHNTPVLTSTTFNSLAAGKQLFFKCENFQKTGSFKARGALNGIRSVVERGETPAMIVTHSSGNHGQAVAWAAAECDIPCTIVVPRGTPSVKETADKIAEETGGVIIHPYDNYDVMAGQGTIGLELIEQVPDLDIVLVPISGGGMTAGIATAVKTINPRCKVVAVEPQGKNLAASLKKGERLWPNPPQFLDTIAEGIMTQQVGQLTFPILCDLCDDVITVTDADMAEACRLAAERMKLVVEAASGAAIAATWDERVKAMEGDKVGVILCGGNVDTDKLPWCDKRIKK